MKTQLSRIFFRSSLIFSICLMIVATAYSQNQNALDFDNVDDNVSVPNASALIANSTQISLTCWVNPSHIPTSWTDFDGFCGFRNDNDVNFYLLQLTATDVEARFKVSTTLNYTLTYTGLQLNTWQHFALTYDGASLKLFHNGVLVGDTPASGIITNTTSTFYLGNLPYFTTANFYLMGRLDEVSLWNYALSPVEIQNIFQCQLDSNAWGLQLCYKFNQGIANGVNTGLTTLHDNSPNHLNGTLNNFALSGTTSNWVDGATPYYPQSASICQGQTYNFAGQILSSPGTYTHTYPGTTGCDSVVLLNLTVNTVNTTITQAGLTLTAALGGATYQWVNCNTGYSIIPGASLQSYTATANGSYAVIITSSGCSDTSGCIVINTIGIDNQAYPDIRFYPNPVADDIILDLPCKIKDLTLTVNNLIGQEMIRATYSDIRRIKLDLSMLTSGVYFLQLNSSQMKTTLRIVKE
jgi:hypothetical protein